MVGRFDDPQPLKDKFVELYAQGFTVEAAIGAVDRTEQTYKLWRRMDPAFAAQG